jgi:hypothetical protein
MPSSPALLLSVCSPASPSSLAFSISPGSAVVGCALAGLFLWLLVIRLKGFS